MHIASIFCIIHKLKYMYFNRYIFLIYLCINKLQGYKHYAESTSHALSGCHLSHRVNFTPVKVLLQLSFSCFWEDSLVLDKDMLTRVSQLDKIMKKYVHVTDTLIIFKSYIENKSQ